MRKLTNKNKKMPAEEMILTSAGIFYFLGRKEIFSPKAIFLIIRFLEPS